MAHEGFQWVRQTDQLLLSYLDPFCPETSILYNPDTQSAGVRTEDDALFNR